MFNKPLSPLKKIVIAFVLTGMLGGVFLSEPVSIFFKAIENRSMDFRFLFRGTERFDDFPILIILVDESSTEKYGFRLPTPRHLLADLVENLVSKDVGLIGLDILMDRPSFWKDADERLAVALASAGEKIVIASAPDPAKNQAAGHSRMTPPLAIFSQKTRTGYSEVAEGPEGVVRQMHVGKSGPDDSFVAQIYALITGEYPTLEDPWVMINFPGYPSRLHADASVFTVFAAQEVEFLPRSFIEGKVVLIGSGIEGLGDTFLTPFSTIGNDYLSMFGVELHAIVLSRLLQNRVLQQWSQSHILYLLSGLLFVAALIFLYLGPGTALLVLILIMGGWSVSSFWAFMKFELVFPLILPLLEFFLLFTLCQVLRYMTELRQSRFLKDTFKQYISPDLVDQLVNQAKEMDLGGETKELTILFSDVADFTSISEKMAPHDLVEMLNDYLDNMTEALFEEKGTLDKYIGDAIMAIFGAPLEQPDHPIRACRSALRMRTHLKDLNQILKTQGKAEIHARIGINTGDMVVGNIGSKQRYDYTVIGDAVNLGARLEGVNKIFGTDIIISETTFQKSAGHFLTRELGRIVVKGKKIPVTIYELIDLKENQSQHTEKLHLRDRYEAGIRQFYEQHFDKAKALFTQLVQDHQDSASVFMVGQIENFIKHPPIQQWQGEIVLLEK